MEVPSQVSRPYSDPPCFASRALGFKAESVAADPPSLAKRWFENSIYNSIYKKKP